MYQVGFPLYDYIEMHGQQNLKFILYVYLYSHFLSLFIFIPFFYLAVETPNSFTEGTFVYTQLLPV